MYNKVNRVIDQRIRPHLKSHGGDIELIQLKGSTVEVKLFGACANCPSAGVTLSEIVETTIKRHIPEIQDVISVQETSKDLLDFAKRLLNPNIS